MLCFDTVILALEIDCMQVKLAKIEEEQKSMTSSPSHPL